MKWLLSLFFTLVFIVVAVTPAYASLLVVQKEGDILWKVLSAENEISLNIPKHSSLGVSKIGSSDSDVKSVISLAKEGDKINLVVSSSDGTQELDVTGWKEDLVEIEERPEIQKIGITLSDGKFNLRQRGITAITDFPITIDPKTAELSVKTQSGNKFLSILPYEAAQSALRTKLINKISDGKIEILEEKGDLAYRISGEKVFNFFNFYSYSIPISSYVSVSTGEVLRIDSPTVFKYLTLFI